MKQTGINSGQFLVLVVDDLPSNLQILRGILEPTGYELTFACGGEQALDRVKIARPDLIVLDLMMPDVDGFTVCKTLQDDPEFANIPIVFLTASHEEANIERAFACGAVVMSLSLSAARSYWLAFAPIYCSSTPSTSYAKRNWSC
ncbi:MAG: response regulator [Spirulinaceae cyanobacterium RM2_2_10]|nr:response regulator [Spirulinaceae cyanobacterium RM2_2_10]